MSAYSTVHNFRSNLFVSLAGLPLQADVVADLEAQLEAAAEVALNVNRLLNTDITLTPNGVSQELANDSFSAWLSDHCDRDSGHRILRLPGWRNFHMHRRWRLQLYLPQRRLQPCHRTLPSCALRQVPPKASLPGGSPSRPSSSQKVRYHHPYGKTTHLK